MLNYHGGLAATWNWLGCQNMNWICLGSPSMVKAVGVSLECSTRAWRPANTSSPGCVFELVVERKRRMRVMWGIRDEEVGRCGLAGQFRSRPKAVATKSFHAALPCSRDYASACSSYEMCSSHNGKNK